jgi:Cd2+/Zn2+-exporting ATPase
MSNNPSVTQKDFKVQGMDCAEEVTALKRELEPLAGIVELGFNVLDGRMTVTWDATKVDEAALTAAVSRAGFTATPWSTKGTVEPPTASRQSIAVLISGLTLMLAMVVHALAEGWQAAIGLEEATMPWFAAALYLAAVVSGSWFVVPKALNSLRRFRLDMNALMTVAVAGAIGIGELPEAATVAFLFALSLWLESWSVGRARRAVAALMSLSPEQARILDQAGVEQLVDVDTVATGTMIRIRPGERIPLDGRIALGTTTVNQAPISGESIPVAKQEGDDVYAGSINEDGAIEVITTKSSDQSAISRIIALVADAQQRRSPSEQWVERFAQVYTPMVLVFALVVMMLPPLLGWGAFAQWFYQGLVLLVIACPCALVISTPVSIVAALAASAKRGILIKGGSFVEIPAKLRAIAFDKTGTITEGKPEVVEIVPAPGHTADEVLASAAAIEAQSDHPLAKSIVKAATTRKLSPSRVDNVQTIKGKGITATVEGTTYWLGSHRLLEERQVETPEQHTDANRLARRGASVVAVGKEDHACGLIALADVVRPNAASVMKQLRLLGVERLILLTGDNDNTAQHVASQVGLTDVRSQLLPEDKVAEMERLVDELGTVAMVGDGINDAPALARSSLGIAMGAMGTDAAIEAADIALMGDDLSALPWLIQHSRRTLRVIRQNIWFSIAVKALFAALTVFGYASLWAAIAADTGASLLVVGNGLRLLSPRTVQ